MPRRRLLQFASAFAIAIVSLDLLIIPISWAGAQLRTLPHDSDLLTKLKKHDFTHVRDDNTGRLDLMAVLWALSKVDCSSSTAKTDYTRLAKLLGNVQRYTHYLESDSTTGNYPSKEFGAIGMVGVFGGDTGAMLIMNPNAIATAAAIDAGGCGEAAELANDVILVLDHHINWHEQNLGHMASLEGSPSVQPPSTNQFDSAINAIYSPSARSAIRRQLQEINSQGGQFLVCTYGPTNPDSTGTDTVSFWYKTVTIPLVEMLKVSGSNPLAELGDTPRDKCPSTLEQAYTARGSSVTSAMSKIDPVVLPPKEIPLDRVLGNRFQDFQMALKDMDSYRTTQDPQNLNSAINLKAGLIRDYTKNCAIIANAANSKSPVGNEHDRQAAQNNLFCQIAAQLKDDLQEIPDGAQNVRQAGTSAQPGSSSPPPPAGGQYAAQLTTIDLIDMAGVTAGREFHARTDRAVMAGAQVILPAGADVYLKGSVVNSGAAPPPGMFRVQVTVVYAIVNGVRLNLTSNAQNKTLGAIEGRPAISIGRGPSLPLPTGRSLTVSPGSKLSFLVQVSDAR